MLLHGLKNSVGFPLAMIEVDVVDMQFIIRVISSFGIFSACSEFLTKDHSSMSNAFSRSILSIIFLVRPEVFLNESIAF